MRRLSDEEVQNIRTQAGADSEVGRMWRRVIRHAEAHGGVVEQVLRRAYGPLWGDHYVRSATVAAYELGLALDEVNNVISAAFAEKPADTPEAIDRVRQPAEWFTEYLNRAEALLSQAREEGWSMERVSAEDLALFCALAPNGPTLEGVVSGQPRPV